MFTLGITVMIFVGAFVWLQQWNYFRPPSSFLLSSHRPHLTCLFLLSPASFFENVTVHKNKQVTKVNAKNGRKKTLIFLAKQALATISKEIMFVFMKLECNNWSLADKAFLDKGEIFWFCYFFKNSKKLNEAVNFKCIFLPFKWFREFILKESFFIASNSSILIKIIKNFPSVLHENGLRRRENEEKTFHFKL